MSSRKCDKDIRSIALTDMQLFSLASWYSRELCNYVYPGTYGAYPFSLNLNRKLLVFVGDCMRIASSRQYRGQKLRKGLKRNESQFVSPNLDEVEA